MRRNTIKVARYAEALGVEIELALQKISLDCYRGVIEKTPVDTGRARASWRIQEGEPDNSVEAEGGGSYPAPQIPLGIQLTGTKTVWITNNLPYAVPLEEGHSRQAPNGMVSLTIAEVEAEAAQYLPRRLS